MGKLFAAGVGGLALIGLVLWFGGQTIGAEVLRAGWAIPGNILVHLGQLLCAACAWRQLVSGQHRSVWAFLRFRLIREGVNSLLPVAQIGGSLVAIRVMVADGIAAAAAAAGTTLDLTLEAALQLVFILLGLLLLGPAGLHPDWLSWIEEGLAAGAVGLILFIAAQRAGVLRLLERLPGVLQRRFRGLERLRGLQAELQRLQRDRGRLARAAFWHFLSWAGGSFEVALTLSAMGHALPISDCFIIESLGMAARSAGFAVPGALGIQEGGFMLVCSLFGLAPDLGLALSMVKRLRELAVGGVGLLLWQGAEIARWRRGRTS